MAAAYPCSPGKQYYGRGAKQLSWNYNYGAFSVAMFGDVHTLLRQVGQYLFPLMQLSLTVKYLDVKYFSSETIIFSARAGG